MGNQSVGRVYSTIIASNISNQKHIYSQNWCPCMQALFHQIYMDALYLSSWMCSYPISGNPTANCTR